MSENRILTDNDKSRIAFVSVVIVFFISVVTTTALMAYAPRTSEPLGVTSTVTTFTRCP